MEGRITCPRSDKRSGGVFEEVPMSDTCMAKSMLRRQSQSKIMQSQKSDSTSR